MVISPIMPTTATVTKDSEGDTETYSFRGLIAENIYNFGRDSLVICPRVDNPLYTAGTFGVEVGQQKHVVRSIFEYFCLYRLRMLNFSSRSTL